MDFDYTEPQPTYYANTAIFSKRLPINRRQRKVGPICKEVLNNYELDFEKIIKELLDIKKSIYSGIEFIQIKLDKIQKLEQKINLAHEELEDIINTKLPLFKRKEKIKEREEQLKKLRIKIHNYIFTKNVEFEYVHNNLKMIVNFYSKYKQKYLNFKQMFLINCVEIKQIISVVNFLCSNGIIIKNYYENNANSLSEKMIQNIKKEIVESLSINYEDIIYKNIDEEIVENIMMDYENIIVNNLEFSKKIKKI